MNLSQKCQYALRALFELAHRPDGGPISSRQIAAAQAIPPNFLELILKEMRQAGWVDSSRGPNGGYVLAVRPNELSVGEVIRFFEGPLSPVKRMDGTDGWHCQMKDRCAFAGLWDRAKAALSEVYDRTTFQDIMAENIAVSATAFHL